VTFDEFAAFVQETGHDAGSECLTLEDGREKVAPGLWRISQSGSHSAVCMNWRDRRARPVRVIAC
jgi:hypothetical protein